MLKAILLLFFASCAAERKLLSSSSNNYDPTSDGADSSGNIDERECAGRGRSFCEGNFAVRERECPRPCKRNRCSSSSESKHTSDIRAGVYDFVYVRNDSLCVRKCDRGGFCLDWETYRGEHYCKAIRCDPSTLDGCHGGNDFDRPTCEDCVWIFPNACGDSLSDSVDRSFDHGSDSSSSSSSSRDLKSVGVNIEYMLKGPAWEKWSRKFTAVEWKQWVEWNPWFKDSKWAQWGEWTPKNGFIRSQDEDYGKSVVLLLSENGTIVSKSKSAEDPTIVSKSKPAENKP